MLGANISGWSIVLLGAWDPRIFSAHWIGNGRLTNERSLELGVPMEDPAAPRVIKFEGITLEITSNRFQLKVSSDDDALLGRIQQAAIKVLTELPHTPLGALGVNFSFCDKEPSPKLTQLFDFSDNGRIADQNWVIYGSNLRRELLQGELLLNLALNLDKSGTIRFDLNYHHAVTSAGTAIAALRADIVALKRDSQSLIERIYYAAE